MISINKRLYEEGRFAKIVLDKLSVVDQNDNQNYWIILGWMVDGVKRSPVLYCFYEASSPQFTEVRFVFCFFLLLTDGWLTRQEFSATSSQNKQNKQRWPGGNISITSHHHHHATISPWLSCFRYTRNEESLVVWRVRISRRSARSPRVPIRSSCPEDAAKCVLGKMTVSLLHDSTTHPPGKRCQAVFL